MATGSNDKTVKLMRYNDIQKQLEGREVGATEVHMFIFFFYNFPIMIQNIVL